MSDIKIGRNGENLLERYFDSKKKNKEMGRHIEIKVIRVGLNEHGPESNLPLKGKKLSPSHF
jgi:hypothetical protein